MRLFEKFINNRLGRTVWLVLIFAFTFFVENIFFALIITAGMAWLAIDYAKQYKNSKHKKAWKIFAIISPQITYLIYYVKIEIEATSPKNLLNTRSKFTLLFGSLIFIGLAFYIFLNLASQWDLESLYLEKNDELVTIETQSNDIYIEIDETSEKEEYLYEEYIVLLNQQVVLTSEMLDIIRRLESKPIYRLVPEYNNSLKIQRNRLEQYSKKLEVDVQWYKEQLEEVPNQNKLSDLLKKSNIEDAKLQKAASEANVDNQKDYSMLNLIFSHYWILISLMFLNITGLLLTSGCFILFVKEIKNKEISLAVVWIALCLVDALSLTLLLFLYI